MTAHRSLPIKRSKKGVKRFKIGDLVWIRFESGKRMKGEIVGLWHKPRYVVRLVDLDIELPFTDDDLEHLTKLEKVLL